MRETKQLLEQHRNAYEKAAQRNRKDQIEHPFEVHLQIGDPRIDIAGGNTPSEEFQIGQDGKLVAFQIQIKETNQNPDSSKRLGAFRVEDTDCQRQEGENRIKFHLYGDRPKQ